MKLAAAEIIENVLSKSLTHKQIVAHLNNNMPQKMIEFCKEKNGIGLAAPQIALFQSFFVAKISNEWRVFFNPTILHKSDELISIDEGCLSYPGLLVKTQRSKEIIVQFFAINKMLSTKLSGLDAIVFQHEYDHLQGITISTLFKDGKAKKSSSVKNTIAI